MDSVISTATTTFIDYEPPGIFVMEDIEEVPVVAQETQIKKKRGK